MFIQKFFGENQQVVIHFSRQTCKKLIPYWLSFYEEMHAGKNRNYIACISQNVSPVFLKEAQTKISELKEWISSECRKDENQGDLPFFFFTAMDTFILAEELKENLP